MVDRSSSKLNPVKSSAPLKLLSVEALKKALRFVHDIFLFPNCEIFSMLSKFQVESFNQCNAANIVLLLLIRQQLLNKSMCLGAALLCVCLLSDFINFLLECLANVFYG